MGAGDGTRGLEVKRQEAVAVTGPTAWALETDRRVALEGAKARTAAWAPMPEAGVAGATRDPAGEVHGRRPILDEGRAGEGR